MRDIETLRALLAEARRELGCIEALTVHPGVHNGPGGDALFQFLERIDAALAEPSTQWAHDPFWGGRSVEARVNGCYVEIHDVDYDDEFPWQWSISRSEIAESGNAKTKEAAMEAALKFVKELTR